MSVWGKPLLIAAGQPDSGSVSGNPVEFTGNGDDFTSINIACPVVRTGTGTPSLSNIVGISPYSRIWSFHTGNLFELGSNDVETGILDTSTGSPTTGSGIRTINYYPITLQHYPETTNQNVWVCWGEIVPSEINSQTRVYYYGSSKSFLTSTPLHTITGTTMPIDARYIKICVTGNVQPSDLVSFKMYLTKKFYLTLPEKIAGGTVSPHKAIRTYYFMEFDGTENWSQTGTAGTTRFFRYTLSDAATSSGSYTRGCSHFDNANITSTTQTQGFYAYTSSGTTTIRLQFRPNLATIADLTEWKQFLSDQKTAGTPVQVYFQDPLQTELSVSSSYYLYYNTFSGYNKIQPQTTQTENPNDITYTITYPKNRLFYLS